MAGDADIQALNRTLKEIASELKKLNRVPRIPERTVTPTIPHLFGWRTADQMEREGSLRAGDLKFDSEERVSFWDGSRWSSLTKIDWEKK